MVVLIVNLTDAPGCKHAPTQVDIYNKTLDPGGSLRIPADLIDKKIKALEHEGFVSIGQIPSWYSNAKANKGRKLSIEEKNQRINPKIYEKRAPSLSLVDVATPSDDVVVVAKRKR